ncbi:MAG: cytochrome c maturation protein CcmE [Actinobacteria bacterium]|nr:cytochrome c maturation protein CcmE [Actinomycetota bacterium]
MSDLPPAAPAVARRAVVAWLARPSGKLLFLGAALAAALGFLIWTATQGAAVYYYTVGEVRAMGSAAYDRLIRVNGQVVYGSIATPSGGQPTTFRIHDATGELPVAFRGTPPDLFGYSTEDRYQDVVVEGQLHPNGTFEARNLIVKHGPEFEPRQVPAR